MNNTQIKQTVRTSVAAGFALLLFMSVNAITLRADETSEPTSGLTIEDAVVTPAGPGETAIVGFRLDNFSARDVILLGAASPEAGSASIMLREGGFGAQVANAIAVMQGENLDLRTSHIWLELQNLKTEIKDGDQVPFELVFASGPVWATAHAHANALPGIKAAGPSASRQNH